MALQPTADDEEGESQGGSAYWRVDTKYNLSLENLGTFLHGNPHMLELRRHQKTEPLNHLSPYELKFKWDTPEDQSQSLSQAEPTSWAGAGSA